MPIIYGFYVLDDTYLQVFYNEANQETHNPLMVKGSTLNTDFGIEPVKQVDYRHLFTNGQYVTVDFENQLDSDQLNWGLSIVIKQKFVTLPATETLFLELQSSFIIQLFVQSDGRIKVKSNNETLLLHTTNVPFFIANQFNFFKFSITRIQYQPRLIITLDCDIAGAAEEIKGISNTVLNVDPLGLIDEYKIQIGKGVNGLNLVVEQVSVFRGTVKLKKSNIPYGCYVQAAANPNDNPCKVETMFTPTQHCLDCTQSAIIYWRNSRILKTLKCTTDATLPVGDVLRSAYNIGGVFYGDLNIKISGDIGRGRTVFPGSQFDCFNSNQNNCLNCSSTTIQDCNSCVSIQNRKLNIGKDCELCTPSLNTFYNPSGIG